LGIEKAVAGKHLVILAMQCRSIARLRDME
jgi:hypothetical protein